MFGLAYCKNDKLVDSLNLCHNEKDSIKSTKDLEIQAEDKKQKRRYIQRIDRWIDGVDR
jgi:hypothetical protein